MKQVIDASTFLAYLQGEPGAESAKRYVLGSAISAVNYSEVAQKAMQQGSYPIVQAIIKQAGIKIIPFDQQHAAIAAGFHEATIGKGISLADRACMAAGKVLGLPVVTGDNAWEGLLVDVKMIFFRRGSD